MKVLKFITIMMMLIGTFSCAEKGEFEDKVLKPIFPNDEVNVFFEEYLPAFSGIRSECFFDDDKENMCVIINNVDEFRKFFSCSSTMLPVIDFKSYTLIVGQHQMGGTGYSVDEQNLVVGSKRIELNIKVKCPEGSFGVICPMHYWGIYPKIQNKSISVNITFQKGGLCL